MSSTGNAVQQLRSLVPQGDAFDPTRWDHWLLILCFLSISAVGLWLSWQWRQQR
ncbi:MAG: hypothetical protein AAFQ61_13225 [Cyanobacteria bacterium J06626_23]